MKKKALKKEFRREIRKSRQRFLSIFLISALGVAFFAGLRSCKGDMLLSADAFYDATNLMDARIVSTMGLTEEDVTAVRNAEGIAAAEGVITKDAFVPLVNKNLVVRMYSLTETVNTYRIEEGRLPQSNAECAVDERFLAQSGYRLGDKIKIVSGDETEITDSLWETELTITGSVTTGRYLSSARGSSTIGNGEIASFLVLYPDNMKSEYYTELAVVFEEAAGLNTYQEAYDELVEERIDALEALAEVQVQKRLETIQSEAYTELDEAYVKLQEQEQQLEQAATDIIEGKKQLQEGFASLESSKTELEAAKEAAPNAFTEYEQQLADAKLQLEQAYEELALQEEPVLKARAEYDDYVERLSAISQGPKDIARILALKGIYEEDIIEAEQQIADARAELDAKAQELAEQETELEMQKQTLADELVAMEQELVTAEEQLLAKKQELEQAEMDYINALAENSEAITEAYQEIEQKRTEVRELAAPEWYLLDRNTLEAYVGFEQDADRMEAIGKVFPAIFFLVAALVSLTTMTRMVDEERTQIGTLKALGYSKGAIAGKYIKYALYATLLGSVFGVALGSKIFPYIVITTYKLVYSCLPEVIMPINWNYAILATGLAVLCTTLAALSACIRELKEQPSALMRPVAPKAGKRLLLERVGFLWKRLSFTKKASLRNMFRYKKRFFMTVIGIGGCMALLLVGFGIKDSICVMSEIQYEELWLQDVTVGLAASTPEQQKELEEMLLADAEIQSVGFVKKAAMDFATEHTTKTASIMVMPKEADFQTFFVFRDRESKKQYTSSDDGVILTEKLARMLDVSVGDTITLKPEETKVYSVRVVATVENYISHYAFLTAGYYEQIFGEAPEYNTCLLRLWVSEKAAEEAVAERILEQSEIVTSVSLVSTLQKSIDDMLQSLNVITYVLIVCAGLLAFIVLYNLSNINITERKRELATLKVLGFYDGEVSAYVYRENVLLTLLGIVAGLFLGKVLHIFVMQTVEVDMVMFGRIIEPESYLYSTLLTLVFAIVIGIFMHFKLKKIDMIESLKSIE